MLAKPIPASSAAAAVAPKEEQQKKNDDLIDYNDCETQVMQDALDEATDSWGVKVIIMIYFIIAVK